MLVPGVLRSQSISAAQVRIAALMRAIIIRWRFLTYCLNEVVVSNVVDGDDDVDYDYGDDDDDCISDADNDDGDGIARYPSETLSL